MISESSVTKPTWLSVKDAAEYLDVGEQSLYRWIREKKITYRKVGDAIRFLPEDLEAMVRVYPSEEESDRPRRICPFCHHEEMLEGSLHSTGTIYFTPRKTRFWTLKDSNIPVTAVMCSRCGAVVLFGDTAKLSALRQDAPAADPSETR